MNIAIWFGSTEVEQRKKTEQWIYETIGRLYKEMKWEFDTYSFPEQLIEKFRIEFKKYQDDIEEVYNIADKERNVERYFKLSYWTTEAYDWYNTIFVKVNYWHINCKNPMSPDWMSLFQVSETYSYTTEDFN